MATDPHTTPPEDRDPDEYELSRRSEGSAVNVWLILGGVLLLAAAVFVVSALI